MAKLNVADLVARIQKRDVTVGVLGLGYVGLPLAMGFVRAGCRVLGFDVDPAKITELEAGRSYIPGIETPEVAKARKAGTLRATSDFARLKEPDALIIAVPTPVTEYKDPDLIYIEQTAEAIAKTLRPGQLVILESTTYPGTTDEVVKPILEKTGLRAGADYLLAYSPEREDPGVKGHSLGQVPKVVGGHDPASAKVAEALYALVAPKVVPVSTMAAAEAAKVLENIYRAVNIALVNELKILFDRMGIDVWEVIDAASTKPFGFQRFTPGPGWGGHCLEATQWVRVRGEGLDGCYRVGELFDRLKDDHDVALTKRGAYLRTRGLEALSLDAASGEVRWAPVSVLYRARYEGAGVEVRTAGGRSLTVTDGHPMLVREDEGWEERRASELRSHDVLPIAAPSAECGTDTVLETAAHPIDGFVYSLEVEGTRSFATNADLVVHNCIPVDPFYLSWKARKYGTPTRFIELAGEINDKLARWVTTKVQDALNERGKAIKGAKILLLGIAYKKDVNDVRESPAFPLAEQLRLKGAVLAYADPYVATLPKMRHWPNLELPRVEISPKTLAAHDVVLIVTDHSDVDYAAVVKHAKLVVDTRNVTKDVREGRDRIVKA